MRVRPVPTAVLALAAALALVVGSASPASAATVSSAADSFTRTVAGGLGSADSGGAWTLSGSASTFAVAGGVGAMSIGAGQQHSGYLAATSIRDTDVVATLADPTLPVGGSMYVGVLARHTSAGEYTGRIIVSPTGAVTVNLLANATSLKSVAVPGVSAAGGAGVRVRLQTVGTGPTTVRARVWAVGSSEPTTWQATTTDATASLQSAGSVGIRTYLSSAVTNGPLVGTVDDLAAAAPGAADVPPTASFVATASGLDVAFDATGSTDSDGSVVADAWGFGDGATGTGATTTHHFATGGDFVVTLTVTDDRGATGTTTQHVTVTAPVGPPIASFTLSTDGLAVSADGSGSTSPGGAIASFSWDFGDGGTASGATAIHQYATGGTYTVSLTVTDDAGASDSSTSSVTVSATNQAPVARFDASPTGSSVAVDGSASSDPDGTVVAWAWDFGDGATASGATANHTYVASGTYAVTLVVTDDRGATATAQQTVTVAVPNRPPVAMLLEQQNALAIRLWADQSVDPDGTITLFQWKFGDTQTARGADVTHTYATPGSYTLTLSVTDDAGAKTTVTRLITVFASGVTPTQSQWLADVNASTTGAADVIDAGATASRPAIVLDIDNTALQSSYQPFVAVPAVLALAQRATAEGYTVLFATGRKADTGGTLRQLTSAGYRVDGLCFLDPKAASTQASKVACRAAWTAQGYTIVANLGNHTTDLFGGSSGQEYLLPNYAVLD